MKKILPVLLLAFVCGCEDTAKPRLYDYNTSRSPIINGTKVTGDNYLPVVALVRPGSWTGYEAFCTGTLVGPDTVVTAAHCISNCEDYDDTESMRPKMQVAIGQNENNWKKRYKIKSFHAHPQFVCTDYLIKNDIAVVRLKEEVPRSVAIPMSILPKSKEVTVKEVDSWFSGLTGTTVGFGMTDGYDNYSSGTKYSMSADIYAYCPLSGSQSSACSQEDLTTGFIYIDGRKTNVCSGDSGGPTFVKRDGVNYLAAVTSFGDEYCEYYAGLTSVQDYRSFIKQHAGKIAADELENCSNNKDDNSDGQIDCDDIYCWGVAECQGQENCTNGKDDDGDKKVDCDDTECASKKVCQPEDCFNHVDDNENGLTDCEEPSCQSEIKCTPEDCSNEVDDNENGQVDCEDPQCAKAVVCQPENCDNRQDDNGNGLADCDDPECMHLLKCVPEDCTNGIDDNGNGLLDCNDIQCFDKLICVPEDCTNKLDDNGDGKVDCNDPKCMTEPVCIVENCTNYIDDNADGLIDCQDPDCSAHLSCQPEICDDQLDNNGDGLIDCGDPKCAVQMNCRSEICNNGVDDNANGLIDCQEITCMATRMCQPEICDNNMDDNLNGLVDCQESSCASFCASQVESGCSSTSRVPVSGGHWLLVLVSLLGVFGLRRRNDSKGGIEL